MPSLSADQRELLFLIAESIKADGRSVCEMEDLKDVENQRVLLRELIDLRLVLVDGEVVRLTVYGWAWICSAIPELLRRGKKGR
jgi:hypothetical protein